MATIVRATEFAKERADSPARLPRKKRKELCPRKAQTGGRGTGDWGQGTGDGGLSFVCSRIKTQADCRETNSESSTLWGVRFPATSS
jgi:hypothetical protein